MPTFRTLFSGGELFGTGAVAAGWTHADGYEIDPTIAAVARLNGFDVRVANVCDVDYDTLLPVDHPRASRRELAARCGISVNAVRTALAVLRLAGYIDYNDRARRAYAILVPCGEEVTA